MFVQHGACGVRSLAPSFSNGWPNNMFENQNTSADAPGGVYGAQINAALITEQRLKMLSCGYGGILPLNGKAVTINAWSARGDATEHEVKGWERVRPAETNTGLLTRNHPTFDIDILSNSEAAQAVEELLAEELSDRGRVMVRTGLAPKRAILCRTTEPFKKITVTLDTYSTHPETGEIKHDAIEVLGDGQQIVCLGVHPDTGRPYEWSSGAPTYVQASDLPLVTEADARRILDKIVVMLGERFGINVHTAAKTPRIAAPAADAKTTDVATRYGAKSLGSACENIVNAKGGSQEGTLNEECYGVGQLVGGGELPEAEALSALHVAAAKIPDYDPKNPWKAGELARKVERSFGSTFARLDESLP
jgi:hypothetical protein